MVKVNAGLGCGSSQGLSHAGSFSRVLGLLHDLPQGGYVVIRSPRGAVKVWKAGTPETPQFPTRRFFNRWRIC